MTQLLAQYAVEAGIAVGTVTQVLADHALEGGIGGALAAAALGVWALFTGGKSG